MKKILLLLTLCICFLSYVNAQTETEPNNVWDQSKAVAINGTGTGTTASGGDEDWWKVSTASDGKLTVSWTSTSGGYIYCQVYDTLGTIVLANAYTNTTAAHNIDGLAKGTYYIRFASYNAGEAVTYSFNPTFTTSPVANNTEPDSTISQAKVLPVNGSVTGHIGYYFNNHRDSLDIYKVTVTTDGLFSYTITSETGQYVYALLYDGDGTTYFAGNYTNTSTTFSKNGLAPGVYYIKIYCYSANDFAAYTLSNVYTQPTSANDPVANETAATASTLPLNGSVTGHIGYHYIASRDSVDWWKVNVSADGRLDYSITSDNGNNVYALLYDGDATTVLAGNYTTTTSSFSKDGLAPGVYYIAISTYYTSEFTSYVLSNNLVQPAQANDISPNDVYTSGTALAVNGSTTGHIGYRYNGNADSYDWYKLTTTQDGQISITITSINNQNIYAELFDGDGITYLTGNYTTGVSTYSKDGLAAGTYYIRVKTYYPSEFSPYLLSNTLTTIASPNDAEPNGTTATATSLAINTTITGHTGYHYNGSRDDSDFYAITLPADGRLSYTITSQNGANVYARLVDHDGLTILSGNYTTGTATYVSNNLAAGTFYLTVYTYYTSEFSPYTLANTFEPMTLSAETAGDNSIAAKGTLLPANTPASGHINFYYNNQYDNVDWWKIGYDGTGAMALHIDIEQNHFNTEYPYINYELYLDTLGNPVSSGNYLNVPNTTINLQGLAVGIYYLKIMPYSSFGAYNLTASYTEKCANAVAINSSTQLAGCNGRITYGISGGLAPYTVQLYKDGVASGATQVVDNTNTIAYSNLDVGTYYLRSYSFGGSGSCNNISGNTVFAIPATPTISAGGATTFCQGGSVTLTSTAASSYLWSTGATTQSIVVTTSGNYSVTAYNSAGCASLVSAATTITVNPLPATPTITAGGAIIFCAGGSVTLTSTAASSYIWSTGATTQSITVNASGSYSVTVKNANGCSSATSAATTVTVNPLPSTPTITAGGATTFCTGGSVTLSSSSATGDTWSTGATTQSITVNATGNYSVTVTSNGCSSSSAATVVTVNPLPTVTLSQFTAVCSTDAAFTLSGGSPAGGTYSGTGVNGGQFNPATAGVGTFLITYSYTNANGCTATAQQSITVNNCTSPCNASITPGGPTTFCAGGSVTLTASAGAGYAWSNGATSQSITVTTSGNYSVNVTNANNCTATTPAVSVTVNPLPATPTIQAGGATTFCAGGSVTLTSSSATNNLWNTEAITQAITVNSGGTYMVTVTNANGCSATSAGTAVTVNSLPATPIIQASAATTFCTGGSVILSSSAATSYLWSNAATTQSISVNTSGNYSVTVKNANGCSATSSATTVTVNPLPTVSLSQFTAVCSTAAAFTLSGGSPSGGTYSGTGVSGGQFNPATAGIGTFQITYSYTNANGCTATAQQSITVNNCTAPCNASITPGSSTTFCQGGSVTLTASAGVSYAWSNGATSQSITVTESGNYAVNVTNANNCTATAPSVPVTVNPLPTVTLAAFNAVCNTAAALTLAGGSPTGGTYSGTGVSGGQFNPATAGVGTFPITYSYTNANGCTATAQKSITVNNCNTCTATITANGATTFCQGGSATLTASAGNIYLWSNNAKTQSITVNTSGSYTVTVTNANGCTATSSVIVITVNPLPAIPTITAGGPTTFCQGGTVTLTSNAAGSYSWSNGATTQSITVSSSGNYAVTVKNASGCASTSAATTVTVNNCGGAYCIANGTSKNRGFIANVYLRNIFNTTGWSNGGYGNYLNQSATVSKGGSYIVSVTPGFSSLFAINGMFTKVWIDWNHDGDFDDAGELVFAPAGQSFFLRVGIISVPNNALDGSTRMRVAMRADASPTSCGTFTYGEVEDYTVIVGKPGTSRSIEPTAEEEITLQESFNLYPNPVSNELIIQRLSNDNSKVILTSTDMLIMDMNGRTILKTTLTRSTEVIDVRKLPAGIYIVRLKSGNTVSTKKIVIAH